MNLKAITRSYLEGCETQPSAVEDDLGFSTIGLSKVYFPPRVVSSQPSKCNISGFLEASAWSDLEGCETQPLAVEDGLELIYNSLKQVLH